MRRIRKLPGWTFIGGLMLLLALHPAARAAEGPATVDAGVAAPAAPGPARVDVGVYICQVSDLNLKDCKFTLDCYVWFRWSDDTLKPYETFDFCNGLLKLKEKVLVETSAGRPGGNYAICHVVAVMTNYWDVRRFPFDRHTIKVEVEDSVNEYHRLQYMPDAQNSGFDAAVKLPGWRLGIPRTAIVYHEYRSNFGDVTLPDGNEATYSRFVFSFEMSRAGGWFFLRHFWAVFVAVAIALLALFITPTEVEPRFGLGVGALFAVVANQYVTNASLPDAAVLSIVDKLHMLAGGSILLSVLISTISLPLLRNELRIRRDQRPEEYGGQKTRSRKLDMRSFWAIAALFAAGAVAVLAGWL